MLYQTPNPHGGDIYREPIRLDFSANTNPLGTPPGVLDAIREALPHIHRYPDPNCRELVNAISAFEGLPESCILCGNGAAELIYAYCEAVKPRVAVELAPTFSEYSLGLARTGCRTERYYLPEASDFTLDESFPAFLESVRPDVIFLCNPNNPTGKTAPAALLDQVLDYCRTRNARLFLDECFLDLSDRPDSRKGRLSDVPGLFILKAFTKSYGMAGVRLGYGLCADAGLLRAMSRAVQPWNVSLLAQAAGTVALKETVFLESTRALIRQERPWLKEQLEGLGFRVCPSEANYLLFRAPAELGQALRQRGVAIRCCDNYFGLGPGWFRTAVRTHEENRQLIQAMGAVLGKECL